MSSEALQVLSRSTYSSICECLKNLPFRNRPQRLKALFPHVSLDTLKCIVAQDNQRRMKNFHAKLTTAEAIEEMYHKYLKAVNSGEEPGILLRISDATGLTPGLTTKSIIERHHQVFEKSKPARSLVSNLMRNTSLIEDRDLAFESYLCLLEDDDYGPIADARKQAVGFEFEIRLRRELEELQVSFLHEDHLRARGYDKTPDVKLEIPVAFDGHVINWIESKALFGDEESHKGYLKEQLFSYWNRFGPGLVLYWFGYVEDLEKYHQNRKILIRDKLPKNIISLHTTFAQTTICFDNCDER
uniref:CDAN1-interacting nuclease 1 n=1 Tax=Moina brachiata TaxID=675436 RepID=A0A4Y7NJT0_9CRUS|nr:EOG090X0A0V [Moina brachiata]SVE93143.1 EOG090X0A0V [Moina brachiata]